MDDLTAEESIEVNAKYAIDLFVVELGVLGERDCDSWELGPICLPVIPPFLFRVRIFILIFVLMRAVSDQISETCPIQFYTKWMIGWRRQTQDSELSISWSAIKNI